jgi:hypothetical protein
MSSQIYSGVMYVPRNYEDFVRQAARPIADVLGLTGKACTYIELLQKDHAGISKMCKEALEPVIIKKTAKDYVWTSLFYSFLGVGAGFLVDRLAPNLFMTTTIVGAVIGLVAGLSLVYFRQEVNLRKTEIGLKAEVEQNWLKIQQPFIEAKLKEAQEKQGKFALDDFDKPDNQDVMMERDQLLLLKSYVGKAIGNNRFHE